LELIKPFYSRLCWPYRRTSYVNRKIRSSNNSKRPMIL
jgi:hypothetical protein